VSKLGHPLLRIRTRILSLINWGCPTFPAPSHSRALARAASDLNPGAVLLCPCIGRARGADRRGSATGSGSRLTRDGSSGNSQRALRARAFPGLLISDRGPTPRLSMRRQSAPTNAAPRPLAPLDECPHRDAHLRSAARHCHPPITRPSPNVEIGTKPNASGSVWRQQGGPF
jgi:hypothetical protein